MNKVLHRIYISLFFIIGVASLILLYLNGRDYYTLIPEERPFHQSHVMLEPSGYLGHGLGILGTMMMLLGVSTYMLRKRTIFLKFGFLKHWLEFHIFLCSVGPMFVLFHTAFKFGGLVAVSFWSMAAVVGSGIIGRFIYTQIPHSVDGAELSMEDLDAMNRNLSSSLRETSSFSPLVLAKLEAAVAADKYHNSFIRSCIDVITDYFQLSSRLKSVQRELLAESIPAVVIKNHILPLMKQKMILARKAGTLKTMQRFFKYWHIFHLPFAVTMFVIMIIHVLVTFLLGYRWIF